MKNHFVNKINGEIDFLYDDKPRGNPNDFVNFLGRYGLTSRIEADQEFDDVDQTFGASAFLVFNGAALQAVADALLLNGSHDGNAPSALFSLSYEYVANYKTDPALGTHSTDVSTDRARAHLYWSAKILRQLDFTKVPYIGEHYDLDLVIDTGISYDRRNAEWLPDVNLTMELGPTDPKSDHVSFVVTYLNGKTKARFENYDGILAGIKKAF